MTMPWSASASPKNFLNNSNNNSPNPKTPNSCAISEAINHEIQHVRSALGTAFGKPKTPTSPAKSPFHQPHPASSLHRHAAIHGEPTWQHPLTPSAAPPSPFPRSAGPRTGDPRLCQFPASPRSPRPSPRPPYQQLPRGAARPSTFQRPSTPQAYSISERRVVTVDDPPRYEARSRQPPRPLNLRADLPNSASLTATGYPNEKTPSASPYHPRQPLPRLPSRGNNQQAPHTAHPLGAFPRNPDSYHRSQRGRNDGSLTAKPEPEGKRSGFQFEIGNLKFNIPSPLSGKTEPKSTDSPRFGTPPSARPRDTRRFGYYEYKTPLTSEFADVKHRDGSFGDMKHQDDPYSAVLFDDRGYPMTPRSAMPPRDPGEVVFPVPEYGTADDLEKGAGEKKPKPGFISVRAWRSQLKSLRERFQRPKVQTDRIPSLDAEAEPQTLEQIEKNIRKINVMSWTTLAGAWLMQFTTFGYIWTWNVFQDYYMNEYGKVHTVSKLAWIGSTQLFLCFAFGIVSGKLLDAGHFYVATYLGSIIFGMAVFILSFLDPSKFVHLFLVQGLLMGFGLGLLFLPSATICMFHFKERKALMTGIAMSGSSFGAMIYPIMLDQLLSKSKGFQPAVRSSSYMVIALLVIANCLIAKPPKIWAPKFPPVDLVLYLRERHYYLVCVGIFLGTLALWFPQNYIEDYGVKHSVNPNISFYSVAVIGIAGVMGRIAAGVAAERLGAWNLLIPATVGSFLLTCGMTGMITVGSIVAVSLFYGFFSGAWLSLLITALGSLALRPGEIGHRVGLAMTVGSLGALLSIPTQAALIGTEFVFPRAIGLMVFIMIIVIALSVYIRLLVAQKRRFQYV